MKIGIIGTGAYAIALSSLLENKNLDIMMWTKLENEYQELTSNHTNLNIINYKLNENIKFTMNMEELLKNKDIIILAIPAKFIKSTVIEIKKYYTKGYILIATKGVEETTKSLIHNYLEKELNTNKISYIAGPSFAVDIIKKDIIGLTLASQNHESLSIIKNLFDNIPYLTLETTDDITGCELCGTLKNILAIISGILAGIKVTPSTNAKFLTDASLELQRIIETLGGKKETLYTYAGIGDLLLTCTSQESRNYTFGKLIGENKDFETYKKNTTIEGLENLDTMYEILKEKNLKSPLIDILYEIVYLSKPKELILEYLKTEK